MVIFSEDNGATVGQINLGPSHLRKLDNSRVNIAGSFHLKTQDGGRPRQQLAKHTLGPS